MCTAIYSSRKMGSSICFILDHLVFLPRLMAVFCPVSHFGRARIFIPNWYQPQDDNEWERVWIGDEWTTESGKVRKREKDYWFRTQKSMRTCLVAPVSIAAFSWLTLLVRGVRTNDITSDDCGCSIVHRKWYRSSVIVGQQHTKRISY
jgi:hypothetical protein